MNYSDDFQIEGGVLLRYFGSYKDGVYDVVIPSGVTVIDESAFEDCEWLTSITISEGIEEIGDFAFAGCKSIKSIHIPKSVTHIGLGIFTNCNKLERITVDKENAVYHDENDCIVESDGKILIAGCNKSIIPSDITAIGSAAFNDCKTLAVADIPSGVTRIAPAAFWGCKSLKSIVIPKGVTKIAANTFCHCDGLKTVTIPSSVTFIADGAFYSCKSLETISYSGSKAQWQSLEKDEYWDTGTENYTVRCNDGDIEKQGE